MQAAWWSPMAIAVIVGILFATFLTLVLVPVLYYLFDSTMIMVRRKFMISEQV
jgi:multidrug efflux pump subunit AcrB